eukprot:8611-Hanusia_phi.AAC.1
MITPRQLASGRHDGCPVRDGCLEEAGRFMPILSSTGFVLDSLPWSYRTSESESAGFLWHGGRFSVGAFAASAFP